MMILHRLVPALPGDDAHPFKMLARDIVEADDIDAVDELVDGVSHADFSVQGKCVRMLYHIGRVRPEMIASEVDTFIRSLSSRNNQIVWRSMTALGTLVDLSADDIWPSIDTITRTIETGSIITQDYGIRLVAKLAATNPDRAAYVMPFITHFLDVCDIKDMARHVESLLIMLTPDNRDDVIFLLEKRKLSMTSAQAHRANRLIRHLQKL